MSLYQKMAQVMNQVSRVPKQGYNSFHKYYYATESDLSENIRPILHDAGLAFFTQVLDQSREGEFSKVKMEFSLVDVDTGEKITSVFWGEGQDKGDKGLYKAYTGATKYFFMKTFLIPTGDDPEGDTKVDERNSKIKEMKKSTLLSKWKILGYEPEEFEVFYQKQKGKTYSDQQIDTYLTKKMKTKTLQESATKG